ncbi:uncharacterized protein LOC113291647 [Papaver somniferum]|uniref:uncharacterized protein LOC113291647 n=1 Tax=Papaver somniferum TaxID=3469 RepID=UPI000E6FB389|nr:uncharacterized protein LOC113291647 [Papaver somniferum]
MSDRDSQDDVGTLASYDPMDDIDRILRRWEERDADDEVERLLLINHWLETGTIIAQPELHEVFHRRYTDRFRVIHDPQRLDCRGVPGHSPHMKMLACVKLLANGIAADANDDYVRMGKTTQYFYLKRFCRNIVKLFGPRYLRKPTPDDVKRLLKENDERGFPGMLGSVDCMYWPWKNCPTSWAGQYKGYKPWPSIVLEAVASYDRWFWHAFFGMPGSCNDLNVLDASPPFDNILSEDAPQVDVRINGHRYDMGYYLADGIYPILSTIVQSYKQPHNQQQTLFNGYQMGKRKDVERAFGIPQAKFHIVAGPVRYWDEDDLKYIMKTCIILHNMISEDERRHGAWKTPGAGEMRI